MHHHGMGSALLYTGIASAVQSCKLYHATLAHWQPVRDWEWSLLLRLALPLVIALTSSCLLWEAETGSQTCPDC